MPMDNKLFGIEDIVLKQLVGKFVSVTDDNKRREMIFSAARAANKDLKTEEVESIIQDVNDIGPIAPFIESEDTEDIMVNNTGNIFVFDTKLGNKKLDARYDTLEKLQRLVAKLKLFATNQAATGNIMDVHLPNGSRCNIVYSPLGSDITIRNFKKRPMSVIDLINNRTMDYKIAARLWLYTDGFKIRPANIIIGGVPAAGKTTLLNAMFSFFRPEQRIVTIEETYELDTGTQENTARLETSTDLTMLDLVKNALRMRPDLLVIGEVRGSEANDMISAMNIGKIGMTTIHGSTTREIVTRLEHSPMNVPRDLIPAIDALMIVTPVREPDGMHRRITQISEISGIETQILLSDIYKYDYRTHQSAPIMPSVTYRDILSKLLGLAPTDILAEEVVRARILEQLNKLGLRDMKSVSQAVKEYYDNPEQLLKKIGLQQLAPAIKV
jgi:flagellar protein FlaI